MSKEKKKISKSKKDSRHLEITHTKQSTKDVEKQLEQGIERELDWIKLLEEKKSLEEQLSSVRIRIIKRVIIGAHAHVERYREQLIKVRKGARK